MIRAGIVGYGYWGPNLARNFYAEPNCLLVRIADTSAARRSLAAVSFPGVEVVESHEAVCSATDIDAVVIATPVSTHYEIARAALLSGKHVFIEKPFTSKSAEAEELVEIAERRGLTLMVDHTFLFTGAVQKMRALIASGDLGDLYYYDSVRVSLGLLRPDVNVVWDLASHDVSIMDYLLGPAARAVSAQGRAHFGTRLEDVAYVTVAYDGNLLAHFHVNWLSPVKIRRTLIGGSRKMLVWDDLNAEEKIKIYDKGVRVTTREEEYGVLAEYRMGDMVSPFVANVEALKAEARYFVDCVASGEQPHNDGAAGLRVVSILEAADQSMRENGRFVALPDSAVHASEKAQRRPLAETSSGRIGAKIAEA